MLGGSDGRSLGGTLGTTERPALGSLIRTVIPGNTGRAKTDLEIGRDCCRGAVTAGLIGFFTVAGFGGKGCGAMV